MTKKNLDDISNVCIEEVDVKDFAIEPPVLEIKIEPSESCHFKEEDEPNHSAIDIADIKVPKIDPNDGENSESVTAQHFSIVNKPKTNKRKRRGGPAKCYICFEGNFRLALWRHLLLSIKFTGFFVISLHRCAQYNVSP